MNRREFLLGAAALALAPSVAAGGRRPLGLVTADLESRLVVVDLERGRVLRHVETLAFPRSIETVGERAVVAHSDLGAVTIVHARTLEVTRVLRGFAEPRYTAAHPDGRHSARRRARSPSSTSRSLRAPTSCAPSRRRSSRTTLRLPPTAATRG